ncbi:TPA: hypothetical protein ACU18R_000720 [Mannheimia haemolytica]
MLTHKTTLPNGTVIEFFDNTGDGEFFDFLGLPTEQKRHFQAKNCKISETEKPLNIIFLQP